MTVRACRVLGGTLCALALALASPSVGAAAMINVTNQLDEQTSGNGCSLREAISAANADTTGPGGDCTAGSGADTIVLPASANHYLVTGASGDIANTSGDLNITSNVTISGAGAASTVIQSDGADRAFDLELPATAVTIQNVTITGGHAPDATGNDAGTTSGSDATG